MNTRHCFLPYLFSVMAFYSSAVLAEEPVLFNDTNLKAAVEHKLGVTDPTPSNMLLLTVLSACGRNIHDLTGIEYATNLQTLELCSNPISDLSAISGLMNLRRLHLSTIQISDLSVLSDLTNLQQLILEYNLISDLTPLSGLTNLQQLTLYSNRISDLSAISGLTALKNLSLGENQITDLSALLGLKNLKYLNLYFNPLDRDVYCHDLPAIESANPQIEVDYFPNTNPPGGVAASDGTYADKVLITWEALCPGPDWPHPFRYMVFRSDSLVGTKTAISGNLSGTSFDDTTAVPGLHYFYWVKSRDTTEFGNADEGWSTPLQLTLTTTPGGDLISPGEGTFGYSLGTQVMLQAKADPLFTFVGWRGNLTANANPYPLTMNADYSIKAHFESVLDVLYVNDDAPSDPGPGDLNVSDPYENGTKEHPFDMVQEAIDVAKKGARVIVRSGTYLETIDLLGKGIEINGLNLDDTNIAAFPIIDAQGKDTVVRCTQREDTNCVLTGLVITGGRGRLAGGILCMGSSPSLVNCLIVGNRATEPDTGGGVYCQDSKVAFVNCTVAGNYGGTKGPGLWFKDSQAVVSNSIIWGNDPIEILAQGSIQPVIGYTDVVGGWLGVGNLNAEPLFAKPGYWADPKDLTKAVAPSDPMAVWVPGDYHLMSKGGRWDPEAKKWVNDTVTSPCIDAGDPALLVGPEPMPNGGRINLGAYGGTRQASLSTQ